MNYWLLLRPDISRPIGGVKQMHRLAEAISVTGRSAVIIQDDASFHPGWFTSNVKTISLSSWKDLCRQGFDPSENFLILPETYASQVKSYASILPVVIFNQNGSYSFGLPGNGQSFHPSSLIALYRSELIHHFLCVSEYDRSLLTGPFDVHLSRISLIRNGIEEIDCRPASHKSRVVLFMPRKNSFDASVVSQFLLHQHWFDGWRIVSIDKLQHVEVAALLSKSLLFLSFGHPEGFGLPVAEALACGCAVIGYSGLGGRELFHAVSHLNLSREIPVGDWVGFIDSVKGFVASVQANPSEVSNKLMESSRLTRNLYSFDSMVDSVSLALSKIES